MKWKVLLLNYDSEWVEYCNSPTLSYAVEARVDLTHKGFKDYQIQLVKCDNQEGGRK